MQAIAQAAYMIAANHVVRTVLNIESIAGFKDRVFLNSVGRRIPKMESGATFPNFQLTATFYEISSQDILTRLIKIDAIKDITQFVVLQMVSLGSEQDP